MGAQKAQSKVVDAPWSLQSPPLVMMMMMTIMNNCVIIIIEPMRDSQTGLITLVTIEI
jgi:phage terminase large subunit-like protein